MSARARWTGNTVTRARALIGATLPAPCNRCGHTVHPTDTWDVDHRVAIADGGPVTDPGNWAPAHATCNRAAGAHHTNAKRTARGQRTRPW